MPQYVVVEPHVVKVKGQSVAMAPGRIVDDKSPGRKANERCYRKITDVVWNAGAPEPEAMISELNGRQRLRDQRRKDRSRATAREGQAITARADARRARDEFARARALAEQCKRFMGDKKNAGKVPTDADGNELNLDAVRTNVQHARRAAVAAVSAAEEAERLAADAYAAIDEKWSPDLVDTDEAPIDSIVDLIADADDAELEAALAAANEADAGDDDEDAGDDDE